jgi:2-C-methyl-D-erythritol 4-phosphate cytidylyltransferase
MNRRWVIVPAAGIGRRMGGERPKQYLELAGLPVLAHVLHRFARLSGVAALVVALHPEDQYWDSLKKPPHLKLRTVDGGAERCHSVYNALTALTDQADDQDWVLVHDAARPCIRITDVSRLLRDIEQHPAGGLLALPMADTVKRADVAAQVEATLDRSLLWRAQTPQIFRYGPLKSALQRALAENRVVTDESQAMELAGHRPLLVAGSVDNIKITDMQDMKLAELYLQLQAREPVKEME